MKSKFLPSMFLLLVLVSLFAVSVSAEIVASGECGENLTWILDDSYTLTINGTGYWGNQMDYWYSPDEVPWSLYASEIKSVVIGDKVNDIGQYAFYYCNNLESVEMGDIYSINRSAFLGCSSLESVSIGKSVETIGDYAFAYCSALESVSIPTSVMYINDYAFYMCENLSDVYYAGSNVEWRSVSVDNKGNAYLLEAAMHYEGGVTLPSGTHEYDGIITWKIDEDGVLTFSGEGEMGYCYGASWHDFKSDVKAVVIESGITSIGDYAFDGFDKITRFDVPEGLSSIGSYAFRNCDSLATLEIPEGITEIGSYAFDSCNITSVVIPASLSRIGECAFQYCWNLKSLYITDLAAWCDVEFYFSGHPLYQCGGNLYLNNVLVTDLVIPSSVTQISSSVFYNCDSLTSVTMADSVESVGRYVFQKCDNLASVKVADNVTYIGSDTFANCPSLENVDLGNALGGISSNLFYSSKITSIEIPNSVTEIGFYAFADCDHLKSVKIPDSVETIKGMAFEGCDLLESVEIGNNVTTIDYNAFAGCDILTSVKMGSSIDTVYYDAFCYCYELKSVYITDLESWFNISFDGYYANPLNYGADLYLNDELLENLVIPENVNVVYSDLFSYCPSLKSVTIHENVTDIYNGAFLGCENITDVYYCGSEEEWNAITIWENNEPILNATVHYDYVPEAQSVLGDINGDGDVTSEDSVYLARYFAKWSGYTDTTPTLDVADLDSSGVVDTTDSVILSRHLAKWTGYLTLPISE